MWLFLSGRDNIRGKVLTEKTDYTPVPDEGKGIMLIYMETAIKGGAPL